MIEVDSLEGEDPVVAGLVEKEALRQASTLNLIAAESAAPRSVLEALGSVFGNKTVEGYPKRRYHRGCSVADELEELAIDRAKTLFRAEHANVQVHSGASANLAVYQAVLTTGDVLLSMELSHGGHLSHGAAASITGRIYSAVHYGVRRDTEMIDYDEVRDLALAHRPRMIVAGGSSYPRLIDYPTMRAIADEVGAYLHVDMSHIAGLVAADAIPSPVPGADFVTLTTYKTMLGSHGGVVLSRAEHAGRLDRAVFPGTQGTPAVSQIAAKAVCFRLAQTDRFRELQTRIVRNARSLADAMAGFGYRLVADGTDTHMVLLDLRSVGLTGDRAETILEEVGILTNRNVIPFDPHTTSVTSGLRMGTPGTAIRGFGELQIQQVAAMVHDVLGRSNTDAVRDSVRQGVADLCATHPVRW
ncbi:MAG: serine hydroxymethyltransferase [Candidatus Limnocylindrales bacterium]